MMLTAKGEFGSPLVMQAVVEQAPRSLLDIGAGYIFPRNLDEDIAYVGVNIDSRQHELLAEKARYSRFAVHFDLRTLCKETAPGQEPEIDPTQHAHFRTLFGDCRFDMLVFGNVFGEYQGSNHYSNSPINASDNDCRGSSSQAQKLASLKAGSELLKPGGTLAIQETKTPWAELAGVFRSNPNALREYGFIKFKSRSVASRSSDYAPESYVLSAKKL